MLLRDAARIILKLQITNALIYGYSGQLSDKHLIRKINTIPKSILKLKKIHHLLYRRNSMYLFYILQLTFLISKYKFIMHRGDIFKRHTFLRPIYAVGLKSSDDKLDDDISWLSLGVLGRFLCHGISTENKVS